MQEERLYAGIGIFVFGSLLLAILSGFFIYSQVLHARVETYVMLFKGSLNGVDATSPITYRGVKIGEVKRIELTADKSRTNVSIPVYVQFFVESSSKIRGNPIQILIDKGITATIASPNILTGTANIELIPSETAPAVKKSKTFHGYLLFPTESSFEDENEAHDTLKTMRRTLKDVSTFVRSPDLKEAIISLRDMARSFNTVAISLDKQVPNTFVYFNDSMKSLNFSMTTLNESLKEIEKAAYSTRNLTDYLARHPESLLRGK